MSYLTASELGFNNHIARVQYLKSVAGNDLSWTNDELKPYVVYMNKGKVVDDFFGGLLFEALLSKRGELLSGQLLGLGKAPTVEGWLESIDELFAPKKNLQAAIELSNERLQQKPLDIWIALPYPVVSQAAFGTVNGAKIHFLNNPGHRVTALNWWINSVLTRWHALMLRYPQHRVQLRGFVWTKASLGPCDAEVIESICSTVHGHGLKIMWCTNYGAGKAEKAYEFGFDALFLRPTYTGVEPRGINWIKYSAQYADYLRAGMVLVGDPRVNPNQLLDFMNIGTGTFLHAFQVYETYGKSLLDDYRRENPLYVYLYCYTKNALVPIRYPHMKYTL